MGKPVIARCLGLAYVLMALATFGGIFFDYDLAWLWSYIGFSFWSAFLPAMLVAIFGLVAGIGLLKGSMWAWWLMMVPLGLGILLTILSHQWIILIINLILGVYFLFARRGFKQSADL